jgi:hypothetical protein
VFVQVIRNEFDGIGRSAEERLLFLGDLDHRLEEDRGHGLIEVRADTEVGELLVLCVFVLVSLLYLVHN